MKTRIVLLVLLSPALLRACSYCDPGALKLQTLRQEARSAAFVVIGTLSNPRLVGDKGATDLVIDHVVKDAPARGKQTTFVLPRWSPVDPKNPPRMLVFFDVYEGKFDPFRGLPLRGTGAADYLRGALALDDRDPTAALLYYFRHLDSTDPDVAADAFLEFAKASDREVGIVGPKLDPAKLRKLLGDSKTPPDRLGLFAFLLGACGTKADADVLTALIDRRDDRASAALSGVLGGLIELRPADGWRTALAILDDPKRGYNDKLAVLGALRFFQAYQPTAHKKSILTGMAAVVAKGDMADMAVEDLRRWRWWDLTRHVVAQYDKPTHAAPLVRNAILRYAITCPDADAVAFVKAARAADP
ncbi:MAG TPA: hypothetical protein VM597_29025, partial [Gemmataceae bacterium]|nr:hypothetical protein [Gemmataceae bacterium]